MLGDNIKKLRLEKQLTQEDLGRMLNKTKNNISQYETGKREPDNDTLSKLSDLFSVSVDFLLGKTNDRDNKNQYNPRDKAKEILEVLKKAGIDLENIDYEKLEQLLKLANIEKQK
jgi:transcriptional regulator with XRE-family HTH domain